LPGCDGLVKMAFGDRAAIRPSRHSQMVAALAKFARNVCVFQRDSGLMMRKGESDYSLDERASVPKAWNRLKYR
jgi:hypothetical protein